ncbi:MAG: DUF58 domain-containing protein [Armatimonadetes bacterium]|nr:DUF58 domain-containing protein [Armatimonadota bacterium]
MRLRRWLIGSSLVVLLAAVLWLGGYWAFVFYAAAASLAVAWVMTYPAPARLVVERNCDRREAQIGEQVQVRVRLRNAGLLPLAWVLAEDLIVPELSVSGARGALTWLPPGGELVLDYRVACRRRGYFRLGPVLAETGDYFGLLRRFMARPPVAYLTVYPRLVPVGRTLVPTSRPLGEVRVARAVVEDPGRPAGVREYLRGDPLRRIHWKATAHTGRLHSRIYEFTRLQGANLILDFHRDAWPLDDGEKDMQEPEQSRPAQYDAQGSSGADVTALRELAVTTAASLAAHLRERHQLFGLISNGIDQARLIEAWPTELDVPSRQRAAEILSLRQPPERFEPVVVPPGKGQETLDLVLGVLARLGPGTGLSLAELIRREHPKWSRELAAVLIVPALDDEILRAIGTLRTARFCTSVIVVGGGELGGAAARLWSAGTRVHVVRDLEGVMQLAL